MTQAEARTILNETLARVSEHFDAVQILATWHEEGRSYFDSIGIGNYYARTGMIEEFSAQRRAQQIAEHLAERLDDE